MNLLYCNKTEACPPIDAITHTFFRHADDRNTQSGAGLDKVYRRMRWYEKWGFTQVLFQISPTARCIYGAMDGLTHQACVQN